MLWLSSLSIKVIGVRKAFYWGGGAKKLALKIAIFPENNNLP